MPYKSLAQERWAHTPAGTKALGGKSKVKEWDAATKGMDIPRRKDGKSDMRRVKPAAKRGLFN